MLWEALTGRRLFTADNEGGLLAQVLSRPIEPPSHAGARVSAALDAHVVKALSRPAALRFASAEEFAIALEREVPLAPPGEVGAWVRRTAGQALADQLAELARVEASSVSAQTEAPALADAPRAEDDDATRSEMVLRQGVLASARPPPIERRRSAVRYLAPLLVLAAASVAFWFAWTPGAASIAASGAVPSLSIQPPAPTVQPSATAVASVKVAPRRVMPRRPIKSKRCDPPYTVGSDGIQRLKPECM